MGSLADTGSMAARKLETEFDKTLVLDPRIADFEISAKLERLYLTSGSYELVFPPNMLPRIERVFDRIIARCGFRHQVVFTYTFCN